MARVRAKVSSVDHTPPRATVHTIAHTLAPITFIPDPPPPTSRPPPPPPTPPPALPSRPPPATSNFFGRPVATLAVFPATDRQRPHCNRRAACARRQVALRTKFTDEKPPLYLGSRSDDLLDTRPK
jgi:hypothetical protein